MDSRALSWSSDGSELLVHYRQIATTCRRAGVKLALYPLSAFRAASLAALGTYQHLLQDGTQQNMVEQMQTRMELYDFLDYHDYEQKLDQLFSQETS